jgi:hypothetical protein
MAQRLADGFDDLDELCRMGWSDERIRRAAVAAVARGAASSTPGDAAASNVTAGAGAATNATATSSREFLDGRPPAPAVAPLTHRHRAAALGNVAAVRAAGYDPDRFYPGWRALLASAVPDRPPKAGHQPLEGGNRPGRGSTGVRAPPGVAGPLVLPETRKR